MTNHMSCNIRLILTVLVSGLSGIAANAGVAVLGVQYQQDELFPEYNCIWHDKNYPTSCSGTYLGGNLHVYVKNTGDSSISITNTTLAGYSLETVLKLNVTQHEARSVFYYWENPYTEAPLLRAAGVPVWYKGDPHVIAPGAVGQAVIRLRFPPTTNTVTVGVMTSGGTVSTNIAIDASAPQLASVGFSQDRTKVYLHWRRNDGAAPIAVLMDGVDVTANTTTVGDPSVNFAESVLTLGSPPPSYLSYHVFQGVYADAKTATASLRAWSHPFIHAPWGVFDQPNAAAGQAWLEDIVNRGFNAVQNQYSGGVGDFLSSSAGGTWMASHGFGVIVWNGNTSRNTLLSFINDEVDAEEDNVSDTFCGSTGFKLECGASPMGILGMRSIATGELLRGAEPNAPTTINLDATFKPENYYAYGQAVDVLQADPYYQKRLKDTYWYHNPDWIELYKKATYIYAVAKACTRAAEPNPFHIILQSTESKADVNGVTKIWPFAPPQCKRIEAYYALAAGAKGISYWWFTACGGYCSNGLGDQSSQAARDVWKEMGVYGNEIKTVSDLLVASHPVDLPLTPGANVWARALAVGPDTMILLVVNDNYYNDEAGFHSTDVPGATVTAALPSWMQTSLTAFEVAAGGILPVSTQLVGNQLQVNLGTLKVTRLIVLTKDPQLLPTIQKRYDQVIRPGLCAFVSAYCTNTPLSIAQNPSNQTVIAGSTANFKVVAFGTALTYQWQTNNVNLTDGAHYSGCTNAILNIANCADSDATSYRCVITGATGTTNSAYGVLTVSTNPPSAPTANAATGVTGTGFTANWSSPGGAAGYRLDVSTNNGFSSYLPGYQDLDVGSVFSRNVSGLTLGQTYYYRVRAYNVYGTSGDSQTISVTTTVTPPGAPTANPATAVTTSEFYANWGSATGATGYQLDVSTTNSFSTYVTGYQNLDVGNVLDFNVSGLTAGGTYYYRVRAYNGAGASGNSSTITVPLLPAAPVANAASSVVSSAFIASWSGVTGSTGYELDLSTNSAFDDYVSGWQNLDVGNVLNRGVVELTPGTTYYYRVRAYNIGGESENSDTIAATLPTNVTNSCVVISNADFEGGFTLAGGGYIADGWTEWEGYPGVTIGYDETSIIHGGAHSQRLRVGGTNATSGGVYQRVPATAGQLYSVSVWTYAGDTSSSCYLGVDPAGGTNGNSGVTWSSVNTNAAWVQKTWEGIATSSYITVFFKVASPDSVKRNGYFDDIVPSPGSPWLTAQRRGDMTMLTWPACPSARLERATALTTPMGWAAATNQINTAVGRKSVTLSPSESAGFYRLVLE